MKNLTKKLILTVCLTTSLLAFTACGKDADQPAAPAAPSTGDSQTSDNTATDDKFTERTNFNWQETDSIFNKTEKDIETIYGQPDEKTTVSLFAENDATEYHYGDTVFTFSALGDATAAPSMVAATLADDKIPAARGIQIGDKIGDIINRYPNSGNKDLFDMDTEDNAKYQLLYGEYVYFSDYGIIKFLESMPAAVIYASEGTQITFNIKDSEIVSIQYEIPLT